MGPWTQTLTVAMALGGAPELALTWEAPDACPTGEDVASRVEVLLGRTLDADARALQDDARPAVEVHGVIRRETSQRFVLTLRIRTDAGERERTFPGQTCEVLADTAALVVAAAVDEPPPEPAPAPAPAPRKEPPEPKPDPSPEPAPAREHTPPPVDPTTRRIGGAVGAGAAGLLGPLPGPAVGIEAAAALLVARARVELRFDYWFSRRATVDAGRGAEIQLWTLGLRGCWAPRVAIVEFPLCGGVQAGPMRGDGFGIGAPTSTRLAWVAFEGGAAVVVLPWRFLGFRLGADLLVPFTHPGFAIDDRGLVHRAAPVGGQAALGIEGRFGGR